jgi:hypothetical protein
MKVHKRLVWCYLVCFSLIVTVDLLSPSEKFGDRIYLVLMPLLALTLFFFSDFTSVGITRRLKGFRWSIMIILIGILTSFFLDNALSAGFVILASSLIAPLVRIRKYADGD